ncbi:hypothetical protein SAMN05421665_2182 [Yoonia rosea]|uniref:Uncharacterized protein n=1 Tax=Yoonia rosea TaxID=287098 RepID=A0A1R3X693_9RHOB|nr:hypothetical protein SAMN05421665_2182 [Yoonia rosea]
MAASSPSLLTEVQFGHRPTWRALRCQRHWLVQKKQGEIPLKASQNRPPGGRSGDGRTAPAVCAVGVLLGKTEKAIMSRTAAIPNSPTYCST